LELEQQKSQRRRKWSEKKMVARDVEAELELKLELELEVFDELGRQLR
jgi:hypothetical protein